MKGSWVHWRRRPQCRPISHVAVGGSPVLATARQVHLTRWYFRCERNRRGGALCAVRDPATTTHQGQRQRTRHTMLWICPIHICRPPAMRYSEWLIEPEIIETWSWGKYIIFTGSRLSTGDANSRSSVGATQRHTTTNKALREYVFGFLSTIIYLWWSGNSERCHWRNPVRD